MLRRYIKQPFISNPNKGGWLGFMGYGYTVLQSLPMWFHRRHSDAMEMRSSWSHVGDLHKALGGPKRDPNLETYPYWGFEY